MKRPFIPLMISAALLLPAFAPGAAYANSASPSDWAHKDVGEAMRRGLVPSGLGSDYLRPLTRGQFCAMAVLLYRSLTGTEAAGAAADPFADTDDELVLEAYGLGLVSGVSATKFAPELVMTREQVARMVYNTIVQAGFGDKLRQAGTNAPKFADEAKISRWASESVAALTAAGIMQGVGDGGSFAPLGTATREQGIALVKRISDLFGPQYVTDETDLLAIEDWSRPVAIADERAGLVYDRAKDIVAELVKPGMSDYEKELAIHDYLLTHIAYDYVNYDRGAVPEASYTMYGALFDGVAVCQGYADSAALLLRMAGIETHVVSGRAGGIDHAWNKVKIGGQYYNLDVTWDDPVPDVAGRRTYGYFNVTDEELRRDHQWKDELPAADSDEYNYFTHNGLTVGSPAEFEARIAQTVAERGGGIMLKRLYRDGSGPAEWNALMSRFPQIARYTYTTDNSGIVTFNFEYVGESAAPAGPGEPTAFPN